MKVVLGLGNPGLGFKYSRHNLGFLIVESFARKHRIKIKYKRFAALLGQGLLENQKLLLAKPLTYVNLSGEVARSLIRQRKIELADFLVVCDDVNLPLGKIRIKAQGSDGGHKGLRSIIERLKSRAFPRLRVGIDNPRLNFEKGFAAQAEDKLRKFVLGKFSKRESLIIKRAIEKAVICIETWVQEGTVAAMNKCN